jgi:diguanylate cyclase (GGDEF)-like protein/PAS domain S-box-containing protein
MIADLAKHCVMTASASEKAVGAAAAEAPRQPGMKGRNKKHFRALALQTHISLPLFAVVLLAAIWAATFHFIQVDRLHAEAAARATVRETVDTFEGQISRSIGSLDQTMRVIKYAVELNGASAALPALSEQGLLPPALVFVISVADRTGVIVASNQSAEVHTVAGQSFFDYHRQHDTDRPYLSQVHRGPDGNGWHLHFTRRINDRSGEFAGIAMVEIDPAYFTSSYEPSRLGERGVLGLFSSDGVFRALRTGERVSWGENAALDWASGIPGEAGASADPAGAPSPSPWDGVRRYTSVRRLPGYGLGVVAGLAEEEQMASFQQHRRNYLWQAGGVSAALVLLVTLVCAWSWQATRARRGILREQRTYAAASEASLDAFFVLRAVWGPAGELKGFLVDATNGRAEKMAGLSKRELHGKELMELFPHFRSNGIADSLIQVMRDGLTHEAEWENPGPTGSRWLHRQVVAVEDGVVAIVRDITARKQSEKRIWQMAHHDTLTGLPNRGLVQDRIGQALAYHRRHGGCVAVAFLDLDGFKLVNDALGHSAGDMLLAAVSQRMLAGVRNSDTVGRFGGDEFVIMLTGGADDVASLAAVLERVRKSLAEPVMLDGQEVRVSCSMGVALYPSAASSEQEDAGSLLMKADSAMYRAKELGKNNIQYYSGEMSASAEEKLRLLDGLRHALAYGQLRLLYQPKVDLRTGRMIGVEALLRWDHPEQGMVPPMRFIPLAEESGLIVEIGEWVLRTACRQNQAWRDAGLGRLEIAVNVSPRQFDDLSLLSRVSAALRDSGMDPADLELEVTEGVMMRDLQQSVQKMRELKATGVSLSIDDFGTGYSSLSALKTFPISRLKIDKSFVRELVEQSEDQAIAKAIISLGHQLNLRVIAEGVETEMQRQFLRDNDCDEMQGYLFSRPVSADAIAAMLHAQASAGEEGFPGLAAGLLPMAPAARTAH